MCGHPMKMRTRRIVTVGVLGAGLVLASPAAGAGTRDSGSGGAYVNPSGDPTAVAGSGASHGGGGGRGGGGGDTSGCTWEVVVGDDLIMVVLSEVGSGREHSRTGRWLQYVCPGYGPVEVNGRFLVPEGGLVDPRQVALDALASVSIPSPAINTSPSAAGRLFVQVPTWLWLGGDWWRPYTATASAGRVTATVRAVPVATTWSTGDGGSVSCRGPGQAWAPGVDESASDCSHTYRRSSAAAAAGRFTLSSTVTFEITWTSNVGAGGTLPAITRTSNVSVDVGEIQAIGTKGGR